MNAASLVRARPHVLAAALCTGLAAANVSRAAHPGIRVPLLAAAAALVALALEDRARISGFGIALVLVGWWWGSMRLAALDTSTLTPFVGHVDETEAVVTAPARNGQFGLRVAVQVRRFGDRALSEPALLELPLGRSPPQGAVIHSLTEVRLPKPEKNGFDERAWLRRQGVHVVLDGQNWSQVGRRGGVGGLADRLRRFVSRGVAAGLRGERAAVIAGIVLGADEGLSPSLQDRFRRSGLYHLLAVSGQNVAIIAGGVLLLASLLGIPRLPAELGVLGAIASYVLAVGFQPSVVRAGISGALASLAWLCSRPRDRWYFLLVAAAALLAWNPYSLLDPGFELSFAAVASIFLVVPRLDRWLEGYPIPRSVGAMLAVSLACSLVTAPILWFEFGKIPLYAPLANLFAEPAMPPLLALGLVSALVHPVAPAIAAALAWLNGWLAAYLAGVAGVFGGLPYAQVASLRAFLLLVDASVLAWACTRVRPPRRRRLGELSATGLVVALAWHLAG